LLEASSKPTLSPSHAPPSLRSRLANSKRTLNPEARRRQVAPQTGPSPSCESTARRPRPYSQWICHPRPRHRRGKSGRARESQAPCSLPHKGDETGRRSHTRVTAGCLARRLQSTLREALGPSQLGCAVVRGGAGCLRLITSEARSGTQCPQFQACNYDSLQCGTWGSARTHTSAPT
jgi:hypothetical protein